MNELDVIMNERVVQLRKKVIDAMTEKHPRLISVLNNYFSKHDNRMGLRVTENGQTAGDYTFHLKGLYIARVENGVLDSEIHHPFGAIKPYGIVEKCVLERMLDDEQDLIDHPFTAIKKYLPEFTLKFQK